MHKYKAPDVASVKITVVFRHYGEQNETMGRFKHDRQHLVPRMVFVDLVYDAIRKSFEVESENA